MLLLDCGLDSVEWRRVIVVYSSALAPLILAAYLIYKKQKDQIKIAKYILSMFLVGFSLALPLYLYDNYEKI